MAKTPEGFEMPQGDYAGDVSAQQAWDELSANSAAQLVDVRTDIEQALIGWPDLGSLGKEAIHVQWMTMQGPNPNFADDLKQALADAGAETGAPVYFLCQSGGRSKIAAMQATELGYTAAFNIEHGFEGELDDQRHRNSISGWKVAGLPWWQT